jgi:Phage tail sheath C-terminal domain/Phage tail sheath protein subtilisin-like domain
MPEQILPGTYITVRDEALISAGQVVTGNIGIVGTASKGPVNQVQILGSFSEARDAFGDSDPWQGGAANELTLIRALEQIYNNGGRAVYAVRTAGSAKATAAYQTRSGATLLTLLTATTPGAWGNSIQITISNATDPSLVSETLAGNAAALQRAPVANSPINSISVKQISTGLILSYTIVYDVAPDNTKSQVEINTTTGALTFTTLANWVPVAADTIVARYQVPAANSKKVVLVSGAVQETYTVADASHLAELINKQSTLVTARASDQTAFYKQAPDNTAGARLFGTGLDGNSAGANGEAATAADYKTSLALLENEIINIVLLAGQDVTNAPMVTNLLGHVATTTDMRRERIALIGNGSSDDVNTIAGHPLDSERVIFVAPGIQVAPTVNLPGAYTAAAVAGLVASLPVQTSPTNKTLAIPGVSTAYSPPQLENLVQRRVLLVEKRDGFRIVKGITTATNSAWHQITTRRIVDYAIYGVRSAADPYIGKLNNERVRAALKATIDAFLTRMVDAEALIGYQLDVSATRPQQIAGICMVTMTILPTFSIDFIVVTMYLG